MIEQIQKMMKADFQIKLFYLNWAFYGLMILASTFYVYARLEMMSDKMAPINQKIVKAIIQK